MREWLPCHYLVDFEHPLNERRRLDAALRSKSKVNGQRGGRIDIALEWEWDNNKVADDFLSGDFRKLFEVNAHCGLAIVHTRADGTRHSTHADKTVRDVHLLCKEYRRDTRSVAFIEIRRVLHQKDRVEFLCYFQDLDTAAKQEAARWVYP